MDRIYRMKRIDSLLWHGSKVLLLSALTLSGFALDVPNLEKRVTDLAGLLTTEQSASLEEELRDLEVSDSTQIAVLIIPSLEGEVLEDYSERVATAWRLGQKGRDNGVLVLLAMKERQVRIEVGYGLEATVTDARSRRIIQDELVPAFRANRYFEGVRSLLAAVIQTVRGQYQGPVEKTPATESPEETGSLDWLALFILPALWLLRSTGPWGGGVLGAGAGSYLAYASDGTTIPLLLFCAFFGGFFGMGMGAAIWARKGRSGSTGRGRYEKSWSRGSHRSGGSKTFFSTGRSSRFSGGGGSFGGGGASGSW